MHADWTTPAICQGEDSSSSSMHQLAVKQENKPRKPAGLAVAMCTEHTAVAEPKHVLKLGRHLGTSAAPSGDSPATPHLFQQCCQSQQPRHQWRSFWRGHWPWQYTGVASETSRPVGQYWHSHWRPLPATPFPLTTLSPQGGRRRPLCGGKLTQWAPGLLRCL